MIASADILACVVAVCNHAKRIFRAKQFDGDCAESFQGGAATFFFQGINGRWQGILSDEELALYKDAMARVLTPEAGRWLEGGRGTNNG